MVLFKYIEIDSSFFELCILSFVFKNYNLLTAQHFKLTVLSEKSTEYRILLKKRVQRVQSTESFSRKEYRVQNLLKDRAQSTEST